jgi:acyl CoA:acetate/3-ketoacid CoA transferase beta subunit
LVTELAVFDFVEDGSQKGKRIRLTEIAKGVGLEEVRAATGCKFEVALDLKEF